MLNLWGGDPTVGSRLPSGYLNCLSKASSWSSFIRFSLAEEADPTEVERVAYPFDFDVDVERPRLLAVLDE